MPSIVIRDDNMVLETSELLRDNILIVPTVEKKCDTTEVLSSSGRSPTAIYKCVRPTHCLKLTHCYMRIIHLFKKSQLVSFQTSTHPTTEDAYWENQIAAVEFGNKGIYFIETSSPKTAVRTGRCEDIGEQMGKAQWSRRLKKRSSIHGNLRLVRYNFPRNGMGSDDKHSWTSELEI